MSKKQSQEEEEKNDFKLKRRESKHQEKLMTKEVKNTNNSIEKISEPAKRKVIDKDLIK